MYGAFRALLQDPMELLTSNDPEHPANLLCSLCADFYRLGWVTGTGGAMAIRQGDRVFITPSGVQKERLKPQDLYVVKLSNGSPLVHPSRPLKQSDCTPLFLAAMRTYESGACIHTHSQHAVMVTLLWPGEEFRISHQEMIKGVKTPQGKSLTFLDTLVIPIVDNEPSEAELEQPLKTAMERWPASPALLVRRHGLFVWSDTWERCKAMTECIDYLLEMAVKMHDAGLSTEGLPSHPTTKGGRPVKRTRTYGAAA